MHKLIITNGVDLNPAWTGRIAVSKDYIATESLTNPLATLVPAGSLLVGTKYYYKVVAIMRKKIKVDGDAAVQIVGLGIDGPAPKNLYWKLSDSAGDRTFTLSRDPYGANVVASGTRTGDGVILLTERNESKISGLLTVNYTADDTDTGNVITIEHGMFIGNTEVSATADAVNQTINVSWDAPTGEIDGYRVYRGTASGCYDGFFVVSSSDTLYIDSGLAFMTSDDTWFKSEIKQVSGTFLPAGSPLGYAYLNKCVLNVLFSERPAFTIDLTKVSNHPLWSTGVMGSVYQAQNDFNGWL